MGESNSLCETTIAEAEIRIAWVLHHPDMSDWLKQALRTAAHVDPVGLQNDVELLRHLVTPKAQAQIEMALSSRSDG